MSLRLQSYSVGHYAYDNVIIITVKRNAHFNSENKDKAFPICTYIHCDFHDLLPIGRANSSGIFNMINRTWVKWIKILRVGTGNNILAHFCRLTPIFFI